MESNDPNTYSGSDNERIQAALQAAAHNHRPVVIKRRNPGTENRDYWLLDSAILIDADTTLILDNAILKLSDRCRDNFIRSANCGVDINPVKPLHNIHIRGIGEAWLIGADHPRATGDAVKQLGVRTYGTDAGKPAEKQFGDWRNIGILLSHVEDFSLENLKIKDSHSWAVSLEYCRNGHVHDLYFESEGSKWIDGRQETILNQDGLDLRQGCRNLIVENISGHTGDDLFALTAIPQKSTPPGKLDSHMVGGMESTKEEAHVCNITICNVCGYCAGGHHIVRFLNSCGLQVSHVLLDGVTDTSPDTIRDRATVKIGDNNPVWGGVTPLGDTANFTIRNINSKAEHAILIAGSLTDSLIEMVENHNPECDIITFQSGREMVQNCRLPKLKH